MGKHERRRDSGDYQNAARKLIECKDAQCQNATKKPDDRFCRSCRTAHKLMREYERLNPG